MLPCILYMAHLTLCASLESSLSLRFLGRTAFGGIRRDPKLTFQVNKIEH